MRTILITLLNIFVVSNLYATAALNSCNDASGECYAKLETVYIQYGVGYAVFQGKLKPSLCTSATWGHYWKIALDGTSGSKEIYATLLSAYSMKEAITLRTFQNDCSIAGAGMGANN